MSKETFERDRTLYEKYEWVCCHPSIEKEDWQYINITIKPLVGGWHTDVVALPPYMDEDEGIIIPDLCISAPSAEEVVNLLYETTLAKYGDYDEDE